MLRPLILVSIAVLGLGCVQRTLEITSDPPGALVYLNGQETGRTPLQTELKWYGWYDVQIRKEGYATLSKRQAVIAPWWQWPPFDLVAELFPVTDRQKLNYTLNVAGDPEPDLDALMSRSASLQGQLQSSRVPTTAPSAR